MKYDPMLMHMSEASESMIMASNKTNQAKE
jgi:hypothetical protein